MVWACRFPEFSASLDLGEEILCDAEGRHVSLSKLIYPDQVFDEEKKSEQFKKLTETRYAQLSLGVLGLGAVEVLRRFGIEAEFHAGHFFGELVALYGAGAWDAEAFLSAAYQRVRWMSEKALHLDDAGKLNVTSEITLRQSERGGEEVPLSWWLYEHGRLTPPHHMDAFSHKIARTTKYDARVFRPCLGKGKVNF